MAQPATAQTIQDARDFLARREEDLKKAKTPLRIWQAQTEERIARELLAKEQAEFEGR